MRGCWKWEIHNCTWSCSSTSRGMVCFYIEGINPGLSPYLTWHIGTKLHSNQKLNLGGEISFGISFLPVPISLEFGAGLERSKQSFVLTSNEESLLSGIKKQAGTNKNILFIADNYELWDVHPNSFCRKLCYLKSSYYLIII